jgi:hypothetical protein
MTAWRMIDQDVLRSLLAGIKDTRWHGSPDEVPELSRRMGWELLEVIDGKGALATAGWHLGGEEIEMAIRDNHVDDITMQLTEIVRQAGPDRDRFLSDAFADAVASATAVLGEPTARDHAEPPTVRWQRADSVVLVKRLEVTVTLVWASTSFQERWDRLREGLA